MNDRSPPMESGSRVELAHAAPFLLGGFDIRPSTREVVTARGTESLEPRVMQVLVALHAAGGAVLTRDELIERCWDGVVVGDDAINRVIGRLRRLAETDGGASFHIDTVTRVGFRLIAGDSRPGPQGSGGWLRSRRRNAYIAGLAALALAVGVGAVFLVGRTNRLSHDATQPAPLVAVLPFDVSGPGADDLALADAITVTLGDQLRRTGLRVISRSSSMEFRGARKGQAGASLGAQYLIDGDILRQGDRLTIAVQLEDAPRHLTIWSGTFEGSAADSGKVEQRVAAAVGAALEWPAADRLLTQGVKIDPQAISLFLEASSADKRGDSAVALDAAHRLIALAPGLAISQATFAIVTIQNMEFIPVADRPKALEDARRAASRAVQIDPRQGEGYVARSLSTRAIDWQAREAVLNAGINADPDNEIAYVYRYALLTSVGRIREAAQLDQRAQSLDPLAVNYAIAGATFASYLGDFDEAERRLADAAQRFPDYKGFAAVRLRLALNGAQPAKAQALLDDPVLGPKLEPPGPAQPIHALVRALISRRPTDVQSAARSCLEAVERTPAVGRVCLLGLSSLGQMDAAFQLADRMVPDYRGASAAAQDANWLAAPTAELYIRALYAPPLAPMRADVRFMALAERTGVASYWRATGHWPDFCASEPNSVCAAMRRARP